MPPKATLGEVLLHYANDAGDRDERVAFLKQMIGEDILASLTVGDAFRDGASLDLLERQICLDDCSALQKIWFQRFLVDCADWSKRNHKIPRIEKPHNRFAAVGAPLLSAPTALEGGRRNRQTPPSKSCVVDPRRVSGSMRVSYTLSSMK